MGNYSPHRAREHTEQLAAFRAANEERQKDLDALYPPMERPCGTPGAIYTIVVDGDIIGCSAHLPFSIEASLPTEAKEKMKKALHDAMLPIVEQFYRDVWVETIAGKKLADDPEPMPKRWELLFKKWLQRCFARGEAPVVDGHTRHNEYQLPNAYDWLR